jgi:hypothetical protein
VASSTFSRTNPERLIAGVKAILAVAADGRHAEDFDILKGHSE